MPQTPQIELMLAMAARARREQLRSVRESALTAGRPSPIRHRLGRTIVRLGHLVAGEPAQGAAASNTSVPAWPA